MTASRLVPLALLLLFLPPLARGQSWEGVEEVRGGVKTIVNPATALLPPRTVELERVWTLGGDTDSDEEFFGVISDVLVDEDRNFYVLDTQLSEVKVYAESGEYLRTVGREGEGPGEFRRPTSMLFLPDGSLGVIQSFPSKMVLLSREGDPIGDFPFQPEGEGFPGLGAASAAGDQLSMIYFLSAPGEGAFERRSYLAFVGLDGAVRHTLHEHRSRMDYASSLCVEKDWNDFSTCWTGGRDGRVYARLAFTDYAVHVWNAEGQLEYVIEREYSAHARTGDEIEGIERRWAQSIARWVNNPRFDIEKTWNPIQDLHARDDGTLWVRASRGARDLEEGVLAVFDAFDERGRFVQQIVARGEFDPEADGLFLDGDYLVVVTDLVSARDALRGGGIDEEIDENAEPMKVICYRMPAASMATGR